MRDLNVETVPLTHVVFALIALGYRCDALTYPHVYRAVLSGQIPAEQRTTNRWSVRRADLPKVAEVLSLAWASSPSYSAC